MAPIAYIGLVVKNQILKKSSNHTYDGIVMGMDGAKFNGPVSTYT